MKPTFNRISHSLLLSGSIVAASMGPILADEAFNKIQIAMEMHATAMPSYFLKSGLSADKMLSMAHEFHGLPDTPARPKLEFALVFAAANKGLAEAQFQLANYYIEDDLFEVDEEQATVWLEKAISQGHQGAKFILASLDNMNFDIGC